MTHDELWSYGRYVNVSSRSVAVAPLAGDLGPATMVFHLKPKQASPLWFIPETKRLSASLNGGIPRLVTEGPRTFVVFEFTIYDDTHDPETGYAFKVRK